MTTRKKWACAALALTLAVPGVALAATPATSTDYKDLATIDSGLKSKIDSLLAAGVFEGVSADTFGIQQNMTRAQFVKVLDLIFGVKVDTSVQTSSFSDVQVSDAANGWSIPYVEAAKKVGLIDGVSDTTFAPGDPVTLGQFATALMKGLGKKVDVSVSPWYADALQQAVQNQLVPANANGAAFATRADLVGGAYAAKHAYSNLPLPVTFSMESAKATDSQTVQVSFNREIDISKAVLTLTQGSTVVSTKTTWSVNANSATLVLNGTALATGDYTVTLSGLDAAAVKTASVTFHYDAYTTSSSGNMNYTSNQSYVLANVIDSGLTGGATGAGGFVMKTEAEDPTTSKFAKEIVIKATTPSGDSVALPGIIQTAFSSNPSVVKVGVSSDHKGYMLGNKAGTAIVNFTYKTINGDIKQGNVNVTVKADPIAVDKLEAGKTEFTQTTSVVGSVYFGQINAYSAMDLKVTDNYGDIYKQDKTLSYNYALGYNFALGILFSINNVSGDASAGATGTVTVDSSGTVGIYGNVTSFELNANSLGGKQVTSYVTVNKR